MPQPKYRYRHTEVADNTAQIGIRNNRRAIETVENRYRQAIDRKAKGKATFKDDRLLEKRNPRSLYTQMRKASGAIKPVYPEFDILSLRGLGVGKLFRRSKPKFKTSSITDVEAPPYYYKNGTWDTNRLKDDIIKGKQELREWIDSPEYRKAAEANKREAAELGEEYIPIYERPSYQEQLKVKVNQDLNRNRAGTSIEGDPTSLTYNLYSPASAKSTTIHEGGHGLGIGYVDRTRSGNSIMSQHRYNRYKAKQVFNDNAKYPQYFGGEVDYVPINQLPGEAAMNARDVGRELGLKIGQQYPGPEEVLRLLDSYPKTGQKAFIIPGFNRSVEALPYVWKALTGTQFNYLAPILAGYGGYQYFNNKKPIYNYR